MKYLICSILLSFGFYLTWLSDAGIFAGVVCWMACYAIMLDEGLNNNVKNRKE